MDLAVVGGGVAGAYVAERVARARTDWSVALFERTDRIGGRLLSLHFRNVTKPAELGGMRFRSSQPLVTALVRELRLRTRPFLTLSDDNRYFLRGRQWRAGEPGNAVDHYRLGGREMNRSPGEVLVAAFERIVPGASTFGHHEWQLATRELTYRGRPLSDWTLHDALATVLTADGHRYVLEGFGYQSVLGERNAADAIPWVLIESRPESENTTVVDGMELIARELATRFEAAGGTVRLDHRLASLQRDGALLQLHFDRKAPVSARRVVLALPRRPLEQIAAETDLLETARPLLRAVTGHPAAKLVLAYERPWWRDCGWAAKRVVSDLPLSKTYYFDDALDAGLPSLMLASYSDGTNREAWCSLSDRRSFPADRATFAAADRWRGYCASQAQLNEAQRQLEEVHGVGVPQPIASAFVDWGAPPHGAAWHFWNPGVRSADVREQIRRPRPDVELFVCGEAYSLSQGWVEGALETAQAVVDELA